MNTYQNILVVIDPESDEQKALDRAIEISNKTSGKITAILTIFDLSYEMTTMLSALDREAMRQSVINNSQQWLEEIVKTQTSTTSSTPIDCKVVWHNRPFESVIKEVIENKTDIVIKATHDHDKLKSVIFTPTDWHLLRKCPCPVLLVKEHSWPENGNILAAVNAGSDEHEHKSLNNIIISEAKNIASILKAQVNIVNSYPGTPVNIAIEIPEFNVLEYSDTMSKHHHDSMTLLSTKFDIDKQYCHVEEGLAEDVIEGVANQVDAELVVLGTIGRTGISAAFIGNTAEHVIDKLNCDVLALKPEGYISPLA